MTQPDGMNVGPLDTCRSHLIDNLPCHKTALKLASHFEGNTRETMLSTELALELEDKPARQSLRHVVGGEVSTPCHPPPLRSASSKSN